LPRKSKILAYASVSEVSTSYQFVPYSKGSKSLKIRGGYAGLHTLYGSVSLRPRLRTKIVRAQKKVKPTVVWSWFLGAGRPKASGFGGGTNLYP
jgi:hypothetical protein